MIASKQIFTVSHEEAGARLQDFLAARCPGVHRAALRRLIQAGQVAVNLTDCGLRDKLRPGDVVAVEVPEQGLATAPQAAVSVDSLPVLAENDCCLVIDKPAGEFSVAEVDGKCPGALGRLLAARPADDLRVVRRLDRGSSGCLVLAKGSAGLGWVEAAYRQGQVVERHSALVEGGVSRSRISVTAALGPDRRRPGKIVAVAAGTKRSRTAVTEIEVEERFDGYTLLRVLPGNRRGHQIRVHLQSIGHPLIGDTTYGGLSPLLLSQFKRDYKIRPGVRERPLLMRMFLHAATVEIPMPDGAKLEAVASLPDELERVLTKLRRFVALPRRNR